jgi:hypothetical protein
MRAAEGLGKVLQEALRLKDLSLLRLREVKVIQNTSPESQISGTKEPQNLQLVVLKYCKSR